MRLLFFVASVRCGHKCGRTAVHLRRKVMALQKCILRRLACTVVLSLTCTCCSALAILQVTFEQSHVALRRPNVTAHATVLHSLGPLTQQNQAGWRLSPTTNETQLTTHL